MSIGHAKAKSNPDSLRQFLESELAAARKNDNKKLAALIKKTEIPIPDGRSHAKDTEGSIGSYRQNLKQDEKTEQLLFLEIARQDGIFVIRNIDDYRAEDRPDWEVVKTTQMQAEVFLVEWKPAGTRDLSKGQASGYLVGYFTFIPTKETWGNLRSPLPSSVALLSPTPIRACKGETSSPCAVPPRALEALDPEFSELARKKGYQGTTILEMTVGIDGRASDVTVVKFLGYGLIETAVHAVSMWKFEPARLNSSPVPFRLRVDVSFGLY
ncbi:MAG TPA: energy transducer TonB [Terriglobales bacterium]|nr:energy transducer TonB [Terriglobales bacterium]